MTQPTYTVCLNHLNLQQAEALLEAVTENEMLTSLTTVVSEAVLYLRERHAEINEQQRQRREIIRRNREFVDMGFEHAEEVSP